MKKFAKGMLYTVIIILIIWTLLTFWAEAKGKSHKWKIGNPASLRKALIIYDPDPFYNLDEQVCRSFGAGLSENDIYVTIATVAAMNGSRDAAYDLYVFCANTYNWRPDWAVTGFIKQEVGLKDKPVVAITLGAGSTGASQKALERIIQKKEARLLDSRSFWLLKPNDESRIKEKNVKVAVDLVKKWGSEIGKQLTKK